MGKFKDSIHDIILGEKISDNIYLDNNGQLICENVVLARTGNYDYREDELLEDGSPEKIVQVYRSPEEVFDEESIKSMNYKPLVDEHPEDNVTPETVGELNKGFMTNVRRGVGEFSNCLMADLVITDPYVIDLVRSGKKRELSVGYTADILEENGQYVMKNIRGNHIALCEAGRAGNARIRDSRAKLDDATVEAKGSFNSLEELKKHYAGATVNKAGSKCEVTLRNGTKLLYSCLDGDKDGKLLFIRKLNDATVNPTDGLISKENYLTGSEDETENKLKDSNNPIVKQVQKELKNLGFNFVREGKGLTGSIGQIYELNTQRGFSESEFHRLMERVVNITNKHDFITYNGALTEKGVSLTVSFHTIKDSGNIYEVIVVKKDRNGNWESDSIFVRASSASNARKKVGKKYGDVVEVNLATWRKPGSEDLVADSDYLESLREMIRYEKPNTKAELRKVYKEWAAKEHHGAGYHDEFLKMCKEFNIEDAELPDPADEKELDRTHFIPDEDIEEEVDTEMKFDDMADMAYVTPGRRVPAHNEYHNRISFDDLRRTVNKVMEDGTNPDVVNILIGQLSELMEDYKADIKNPKLDKSETKEHYKKYKKLVEAHKNSKISPAYTKAVNNFISTIQDSLRPFRVSVGGRKFDTMATSFADAVQKVRSQLKDSSLFKDKDELMDFLFSKKYRVTMRHVNKETTIYTAVSDKFGKGIQWTFNSSTGKVYPVTYKDLSGTEKLLKNLSEVKSNLSFGVKDSLDFRGILDFYKNKGWLTWREVPNDVSKGVGYEIRYSKMPTAEVIMKAADKFGKHLISRENYRLVVGDSDTTGIKDVYPNKGESKEDFISRFMSETKEEYPDRDQRLAVAHAYWKKGVKDSSNSLSVKSIAEDLEKNYMIRVTWYSSSDNTIAFDKLQPRGQSVFGAIRYLYNKGINAEEIKPGVIKIKDSKFSDGIKDSIRRIYSFVYRTNEGFTEKFSCEAVSSEDARNQLQEWAAMRDEEPIKVISKDMVYDSKSSDSEGRFAILHPTRYEFLSVGARSWVKEDSTNIQKFSSYDEALEFGRKYVDHQFRITEFFDSKFSDAKVYYEDLRRFCIENNYYTRGTVEDYENLLMNCDKWSLYEIASDIAQHSNGVWSTEVMQKLRKKFKDSLHVIDHDVEETTKDVSNAPKSFQLREYVGDLIDDEVEAIQGYDETLLRMDLDEETRKTLEEIRNDELDHTDKLNSIYKSLTKDPKPVEDDMYGLVKEPKFRYFMVTVLEKSAKWGDEELNYFVRAKDESEARKKVTGNIVRIVESNHSEYLKAKHHGMVVDAGMVGYLFPKLNRNDLLNAYKYGLGLGAVNPFKGEEGTFLLGSLENIKKYAKDYLGYELVKGYLVKGESLKGN